MDTQFCTVALDSGIMTITLNRPDQRNALHAEANHELGAVFDMFESDPDLWIAIVATWVVPTLIGYTMIWRGGRLRFDRR